MKPYEVVTGEIQPLDCLVLGANLRQGMTALRSLARSGLRVGTADRSVEGLVPAFASRWCRVGVGLPDERLDPQGFLEALLCLLEDTSTTVLLPVDDSALALLSENRRRIEKRSVLALPPTEALAILDNKDRTLELARSLGIGVPEGVLVESAAEIPAAARHVGFPAVIKPAESWPAGRSGDDEDGIRLFCHAANDIVELRTEVQAMLAVGGRPIVQPWLPGAREAISLFVAGGEVKARFAQVAHRMMPPLGGSSVYRESIWPPADATAAAEALVLAAGLEGYAEVEFRRDVAGRPLLMEVNPRLSASVEIAVRAGVDFPLLAVKHAIGGQLPDLRAYRRGLRMRWLGGDLQWLYHCLREQGRPDVPSSGAALREVVAATFRPARYDYVDVLDPRPVVVASRRLAREAVTVARARRAARKP